MRIFLIRHGETVDNVANVFAGDRDSALTVHGSLQAQRLANSLTKSGLHFTHIFSSDLERAYKTASAICLAQLDRYNNETDLSVQVTRSPLLREQAFGNYEGKPFSARNRDPRNIANGGKGPLTQSQVQEENGIESKDSMRRRTRIFLDQYLVPVINEAIDDDKSAVAVVSHGILLSHLWRSFLQLLPSNSVAFSPGLAIGVGSRVALEYVGGWSNTGYLEMILQRAGDVSIDDRQLGLLSTPSTNSTSPPPKKTIMPHSKLDPIIVIIETINGKDHLIGLKRTRGGVGSSKQEDGQTTIESFFKKRKL